MRDMFKLAYNVRAETDKTETAEVLIYGEIISDMPEEWKWSKEDKSAADFDKAIKDIRSKGAKNLLLRINSPGGVCTESVAMRSILANAGFENINIRIEGLCASAATDIATLPGAHVQIAEGSEYMIHNPWGFAIGNANEMETTIERLRNIEQMSRGFYMKRTGQSEEQVKEWMDAETWFTAEQAVEYGFADELLETEEKMAACVTSKEYGAMKALYKSIPKEIDLKEDPKNQTVSNGDSVAGEPTEINSQKEEHVNMEINELTLDQLREGNPALLEQIQQSAVEAERERLSDIDALTIPGYEEMAEQAKADGTSVMEFQKQIVAAMKQKGDTFMQARQQETAKAQAVPGGAAEDDAETEDAKAKRDAEQVAEYAKEMMGHSGGMF